VEGAVKNRYICNLYTSNYAHAYIRAFIRTSYIHTYSGYMIYDIQYTMYEYCANILYNMHVRMYLQDAVFVCVHVRVFSRTWGNLAAKQGCGVLNYNHSDIAWPAQEMLQQALSTSDARAWRAPHAKFDNHR
jgi:hypothetical protein